MKYPDVIRGRIWDFTRARSWVSTDFEYDRATRPTIVGFSSGNQPVSAYWDEHARRQLDRLEKAQVTWVGHNLLTADKPIIERELGVQIPLSRAEDTMLLHYLNNAELCKGAGKDEDDSDPRGMGYMDLWSMSSLYTEFPQWKECRGDHCEGPCRLHDPLGYNGTDAAAADVAYPRLRAEMETKGIPDKLYQNLKKLTLLCDAMTRQGIKVDRELVAKLEAEFEERKDKIFPSRLERPLGKKGQLLKNPVRVWDAPFNPRSPKQVIDYFRGHGVYLDSTEKEDILAAINKLDDDVPAETREFLGRLHDYKDEGKGLKAWTDERYFDAEGLMHPRFIVPGSSMGRLASAKPNFQNVPRVGWGKKVRSVVIPRSPDLILVKADYSQLELRICLWYAGVEEELPGDAFTWLVQTGEGLFEKAAEIVGYGKSARDISKSVSHGGDYGEGLVVLTGRDLERPRTKKLIEAGALIVHPDWEYHGGVVGFNGINLATRLFGSATWENRKKALQIQEAYFKRFSAIREWQKRVSKMAEEDYVQTASGRYLTLLGSPEDKLKIALAAHGQGGGADYVQEGMIKYYEMGRVPLIQVHDELVFELPRGTPEKQILEYFSIMSIPSDYMPGFRCPTKVLVGENWLDMREVGRA